MSKYSTSGLVMMLYGVWMTIASMAKGTEAEVISIIALLPLCVGAYWMAKGASR